MSIEAISWVLKQDIARSSEKFLLLCMANYADERGYCYPSMAALERDTSQDRKTILGNMKRLIEANLVRDTKRRTGATRQIIVYQLVGLPASSKVHYVYKLTHPTTGEFYIGKRSFNGHPELDSYRGSGRWPAQMRSDGVPLVREVLDTFSTSEEALAAEVNWHRKLEGDPLCRNGHVVQYPPFSKGTENGTVEESQFSGETVPLFPEKEPVFPAKGSQKRDTEPSRNRQVTIKEPKGAASPRPAWLPPDWEEFIADRKERKKPMSSRAVALAIQKLDGLRAEGHDLGAVLRQSIERGWSGLFAVKAERSASDLAKTNRAAADKFLRDQGIDP